MQKTRGFKEDSIKEVSKKTGYKTYVQIDKRRVCKENINVYKINMPISMACKKNEMMESINILC